MPSKVAAVAMDPPLPISKQGRRGGGGSGRGRSKGITMEDLKRQTAQRLAQQQPERNALSSPRESPIPSHSYSPGSQGSGSLRGGRASGYHFQHHHAQQPAAAAQSQYHHQQHRTSSASLHYHHRGHHQNTGANNGPNPKLPHGLTVHELKAMTRARLQAEAAVESEEITSRNSAPSPYDERTSPAFDDRYSPDMARYGTVPTLVNVRQQSQQQQQTPMKQMLHGAPSYGSASKSSRNMSPLPGGYYGQFESTAAPHSSFAQVQRTDGTPKFELERNPSSSFAQVSQRPDNDNNINVWNDSGGDLRSWTNAEPQQDYGSMFSSDDRGGRQRAFTADARFHGHGVIREDLPYHHQSSPQEDQHPEWGTASSFSKPSGLSSSRFGAIGSSDSLWNDNRPRASSTTSLPGMVSTVSDFSDYQIGSSASGSTTAWTSGNNNNANNVESPSLGSLSSSTPSIFRSQVAPPGFSGRPAARSVDFDAWSSRGRGMDAFDAPRTDAAPPRAASVDFDSSPRLTSESLYADLILGGGAAADGNDQTFRIDENNKNNDISDDDLGLSLGLGLLQLTPEPEQQQRDRLNTYPSTSSDWMNNNNNIGSGGWGNR